MEAFVATADTVGDLARREEWRGVSELLTSSSVQPCALVVEGEAGIGKTTFWLAAREQARERGFHVLSARPAASESVLAYASLADMLTGLDPSVCEGLVFQQRHAIDQVLLRSNAAESPTDPRAVAAGFLSVVDKLSEQAPVLLAIDDLQWLDRSSTSVMAFAARRLAGPVGILATVRTEQNESRAAWLQLHRPDAQKRIELGPMQLGTLHFVVSRRLGRSFTRPTMVRIHEASGGNPFFAIELARVIDDGTASTDMRLPATLSELVRARLEGLASDAQDLLLAAACLGEPTVEALAAAVGTGSDSHWRLLPEGAAAGSFLLDGPPARL